MIGKFLKRTISILTPSQPESGTPCYFCPIHIFLEHEAGGVLKYKDGHPICARCRVLNGKNSAIIIGDKAKRDEDVREMNEKVQQEADIEAVIIAERTQTATKTKRNKRNI